MLIHPQLDPVAFSLGPLSIQWYGLMYILAFAGFYWLACYRCRQGAINWSDEQLSDLVFYGALGVVLGGRLGSVFFYNFDRFIQDPLWLFRVWEGGMSFHGGLLGVMFAIYFFSRRVRMPYFFVLDFVAPLVPFGLGAGRIGNFINGELWGRPTDLPWGMVFPQVDALARHPSQLYQFGLEGIVMFGILFLFSTKPRPRYAVSGLFALLYGIFRFAVEFVRQPDANLGFVAWNWMTQGQLLSIPLILVGMILLYIATFRNHQVSA